jgi:hypothetical protein
MSLPCELRSHRFCLVAAPLERIAAAFTAPPLIRHEVVGQAVVL